MSTHPPTHTHTQTYTGDTIVQSATAALAAREELSRLTSSQQKAKMADTSSSESNTVLGLGRLEVPPPVFFCSVEPASAAQQKGEWILHSAHLHLYVPL